MRDSFVKKVIVSQSPYNEASFVAFAILNRHGEVAYCRNGDDSWRIVAQVRSYSEDVICFNGVFYAVDKFGSIAICDVTDVNGCETPKVRFINVEQQIGGDMQYLVDGMGELLLVSRYLEFDIDIEHYVEVCKTVRFCVYRLDVSERRWERVSSLGDKVLFIGENSSFALLASDYAGCEGNRIYYTDDYSGGNYDGIAGDHDVGVYSLVDGTSVALPCYPRNCHRPIWITPTLC